jgi:hypothetical protein
VGFLILSLALSLGHSKRIWLNSKQLAANPWVPEKEPGIKQNGTPYANKL